MYDFCLPDGQNLGRAGSKVDKNRGKCVIFVDGSNSGRTASKVEQNLEKLEKCSTADSKFGPRCSESRTKSSKIEKMFYR